MPRFTRTEALLAAAPRLDRDIYKLNWSAAYRETFEAVLRGGGVVRSPLDLALAPVFLAYLDGEYNAADTMLSDVALNYLERVETDQEAFISLLFCFYVSQRFDFVAALLADRYDFTAPLEIGAVLDGPLDSQVRWTIDADHGHRFDFNAKTFYSDRTRNDILSFQWTMPLYAYYANCEGVEAGTVLINQGDRGTTPGLCYCDSRPDYFLIPDYIFLPSRGYAYFKSQALEKSIPWSEKISVAMWRGATTGMRASRNDWRSLERVRMCQTLRTCAAPELFDVGISSVIQFPDPAIIKEIEESGLKGDFIPADKWYSYKYLIDIDGNSSPWSNLIQKLLSGSVVLKVESSRGLQQWYYDCLKPWQNYVPIAPDFSDMLDKVRWLIRNDAVAEAISRSGRKLALGLSYERELERSVPVISAAFRYFRGDRDDVAPFGRVGPKTRLESV